MLEPFGEVGRYVPEYFSSDKIFEKKDAVKKLSQKTKSSHNSWSKALPMNFQSYLKNSVDPDRWRLPNQLIRIYMVFIVG